MPVPCLEGASDWALRQGGVARSARCADLLCRAEGKAVTDLAVPCVRPKILSLGYDPVPLLETGVRSSSTGRVVFVDDVATRCRCSPL
eukprot:401718-Pyramimonas_sp.AAC.1